MTRRIALIMLISALALGVSGAALGVSRYQDEARDEVVSAYFDSCLSGQWREVEFSEETEIDGEGTVTLSGSGRLVRFEHGVETVEYGQGTAYTGGSAWYQVKIERAGTVSYRMRIHDDQLIFNGLASDGFQQISVNGMELERQPIGLDSAPLKFQCASDQLILTDQGYRSVLERVRVSP